MRYQSLHTKLALLFILSSPPIYSETIGKNPPRPDDLGLIECNTGNITALPRIYTLVYQNKQRELFERLRPFLPVGATDIYPLKLRMFFNHENCVPAMDEDNIFIYQYLRNNDNAVLYIEWIETSAKKEGFIRGYIVAPPPATSDTFILDRMVTITSP